MLLQINLNKNLKSSELFTLGYFCGLLHLDLNIGVEVNDFFGASFRGCDGLLSRGLCFFHGGNVIFSDNHFFNFIFDQKSSVNEPKYALGEELRVLDKESWMNEAGIEQVSD